MGHVKLSLEQRILAKRCYAEGYSARIIAGMLGGAVGFDTIYAALESEGVKRDKTGRRNRKLTAADEKKVVDFYVIGEETQAEIAQRFGMSQGAVSSILKRRGTVTRCKKRVLTDSEITEIVQRYEDGEAACEIAPEFDVFHKRILTILRARGVTIRKSTRVWWTDQRGRRFHFRSKWELWTAQQLDAAGLTWDYELRSYQVVVDDRVRAYTPDFWVWDGDELRTLIDVKGKCCIKQMKKIVLFQEQYPALPFELWTGGVLRSMGIMISPARTGVYEVPSDVRSYGVKTYG